MNQATALPMASALTENVQNDQLIAYFGYGSLVNRKTLPLDIVEAIPVTLKGWRRHWQPRPNENIGFGDDQSIALLGIHRDEASEIDGLLIIDRAINQKALDKREASYNKTSIKKSEIIYKNSDLQGNHDVEVYTYLPPKVEMANKVPEILRSYLDVVMQGFYLEFGESGLQRFLDSTDHFDLPVYEDRRAPIYPRHQKMSEQEMGIFEKILA
ncbi:MAG: gamma-glutamylcyclotransferase [Rhizobiaceae bacterium]|nr:gamma-glutamylcyclotransferase [Rhizobiaceae bacterium]